MLPQKTIPQFCTYEPCFAWKPLKNPLLLFKVGLFNNAKYLIRSLIILGTGGIYSSLQEWFPSSAAKNHGGYKLDLYLPKKLDGPKPVVAFITGGAWIIGYKAWGCLLGQQLAERDIIVACIDYRNFPQGTIGDMVADASHLFVTTSLNMEVTLTGDRIKGEEGEEGISWSVSQIKAYFGLSGGYNLCKLVDHFNNRGLYRALFLSMMEGEESLQSFSPELRIEDPSIGNAVSLLPPIILFHGTADYSIPSSASIDFAAALQRLGAQAELILFDGKTHTDLFLQDPLRGGKDEMFSHLVAVIHAGDEEALAKDATAPPRRRLVPEVLLRMASHISPF